MNKKSLGFTLLAALIWGILPLYWVMLEEFDSVFILANRIIWCCVLTIGLLACQKRLPYLLSIFRNTKTISYLFAASILITINWGIYIWGVVSGRVLEVAIGYYLTPLLLCLCGTIFFREKGSTAEIIAIILAAIGFTISAVQYGSFPLLSIMLSTSFAAYSFVKKRAQVSGLKSIAIESTIMIIPAIIFIFVSPSGQTSLSMVDYKMFILLIGAGAVTATPMILFSNGINDLPLIVIGFVEYIAPSINLLIGIFIFHEQFGPDKIIIFGFIWIALTIFSLNTIHKEKKLRQTSAKK